MNFLKRNVNSVQVYPPTIRIDPEGRITSQTDIPIILSLRTEAMVERLKEDTFLAELKQELEKIFLLASGSPGEDKP